MKKESTAKKNNSTIVSIHQPAYLPWLGYFHKIMLSDVFVFFDSTQFEKNSFINRNKIKTADGAVWLTIPVKLKDHFQKEIRQIEIADQRWQKKHWKSIELNYKKAKYWQIYSPKLKQLYEKEYSNISDLCYEQLLLLVDFLDIKTKIIKSSDLKQYKSKKLELVLDICNDLDAKFYVSGALGKDYIEKKRFDNYNIELYFQDYHHPKYEQFWGEFLPYMSIIDLLFNYGNKSLEILMSGNAAKYDLQAKKII